jgi:hypothetical protein
MRIIYAKQSFSAFRDEPSIFLVGPTPRSPDVASWRPKALRLLKEFDGIVFVPEPPNGNWQGSYLDQITWEWKALDICAVSGVIAAWVPRDIETMPAFTTNVEFGRYVGSGHLWYGRPIDAPNNYYLDRLYLNVTKREPCNTLEDLMQCAMTASIM